MVPRADGVQAFVLLDEWVPDPVVLSREEALATMALRYFRSHGPATRRDFEGWTGLTLADARAAIAEAGDQLEVVHVDEEPMWAANAGVTQPAATELGDDVLALAGFDEYLLGFKDRSLMIQPGHMQAIIPGSNGVFRPTFVRGGQVIGTWTRKVGKAKVLVEAIALGRARASDKKAIERSLQPFGTFHGLPVEVRWPA